MSTKKFNSSGASGKHSRKRSSGSLSDGGNLSDSFSESSQSYSPQSQASSLRRLSDSSTYTVQSNATAYSERTTDSRTFDSRTSADVHRSGARAVNPKKRHKPRKKSTSSPAASPAASITLIPATNKKTTITKVPPSSLTKINTAKILKNSNTNRNRNSSGNSDPDAVAVAPPKTGNGSGSDSASMDANCYNLIDPFEQAALKRFDELDDLDFTISDMDSRKRNLLKTMVTRLTQEGRYNNPSKKYSVLLPSGDGGPPTRMIADFYHNYNEPTTERLQTMEADFEDMWSDLLRLPKVAAAQQICAQIRARLRYSRPTVKVVPCKCKKLQRELPQCQDEELKRDIETYNSMQNKLKAHRAKMKSLQSEPEWIRLKNNAIDQMHTLGLRSVPYIEKDGDQSVEYKVVLNESGGRKATTKKKLEATIVQVLMDKQASQSFAAFRLRLADALAENVEYSKSSNIKLVLQLPEEEEDALDAFE